MAPKGATQVILALTGNDKSIADKMNGYVDDLAQKGYRWLGSCKNR